MIHNIWFNIQRLYYSLKGIDYKGNISVESSRWSQPYKVGDFIKITDTRCADIEDGMYKITNII